MRNDLHDLLATVQVVLTLSVATWADIGGSRRAVLCRGALSRRSPARGEFEADISFRRLHVRAKGRVS